MVNDKALLNAILRQDFYIFAQRVFREVQGGETFQESWAVEAICHVLEEVALGRRRRQIVAVPPRSLKTICASVALPAWILGHDPTAKIICVSYAQELADRFSASCRQVMKSGWYRELFPETIISPFKDRESYFRTTAGGFRDATSIGGALTGKGGTIIIIDDPAKADEIMSQSQREAINDWYGRTLISRLDNKLTGRIVLVMQRLHLEDLIGHVRRTEDWDQLILPAIASQDERIPIGLGRYYQRHVGDVLRPDSEPLEILEQNRASMGSHAFSAQYLQRPIPSQGEIVRLEWFKRYGIAPQPPRSKIVQSWDTATKIGAKTDYSVCITAAVWFDEVFILDVYRARLEFPALLEKVIWMARKHKAEELLIEDHGAGISLRQQLNAGNYPGVVRATAATPSSDKVTRMATVTPMIEKGWVYLPKEADWLQPFFDEIVQFPEGAHDDQVDALSQLLYWNDYRLHRRATAERRSIFGYES